MINEEREIHWKKRILEDAERPGHVGRRHRQAQVVRDDDGRQRGASHTSSWVVILQP